ncbi:MAG: hypothetical protein A2041_13355, partial [Bacteroidetes bacterium GWA2_31_9b]
MKRQFKKYYLFLIITVLFINSSLAQTDTLFWFAVPYGTSLHSTREANIVLTATDMDDITNIIITQPYNPIMDTIFVTIDPLIPPATADIHFNNAQLVEIMNNTYIQDATNPNPRISNCAIKIEADREITAYYEYQRLYLNNDIFSLKGTNAMGQDFWVPFQSRWDNHSYNVDPAFAQIIVAATKPNTVINVTFTKTSYNIPPGTYTFNLAQPGMTMMFVPQRNAADLNEPNRLAAFKLGGTHITSNEPIVVTINDDSAEKNGWDFVGDQLVPLINMYGKRTVGLEYLVIKGEITNNAQGNEKVFVLATENGTNISYRRKGDGALIPFPVTAAGTQRVIDLLETAVPPHDFVYIVADKPIYVFHVSGFIGEMGGALVPTIDGCTGSLDVTVVRAKTGRFFLTIMTHFDALNFFEISKNGGPFAPFLTAADFEYSGYGDLYVIKKSSYNRSLDAVAGQPTRIRNTRNYFHLGVINEGPGTCEYGYFSDFAEARGSAIIVESGTDILTACYGSETELKANGGLGYSWTPTTYLDDPTSSEPNAFLPPGQHTFSVLIDRVCFADTTINTSVEIYENTEAFFTLDDNIGCAPFTVELNNLTINADTFLFDFEDDRNYDYFADTNAATTFTHTYYNITSSDSIYALRLYAYDKEIDCPDIYTKYIRVFPEINADFTPINAIGCNPLTVNFTDLSSSPTSDSYKWTFGDGESYLTSVTPANVTHEFSHSDETDTVDFDVELVATSPFFCRDTARATISVYSYLESEFTVDSTFGCSPLPVTITNISAGEDNITLDYGDGTPILNAPTFGSVVHTYRNTTNVVQNYIITLTTRNDELCTKIWTETITVYPEIRANYTLLPNQYTGCNSQNFVFTNTSNASPDAASIYLWTFGDGSTSNIASPTKLYNNTTAADQAYIFNLRSQSIYGCFDDTSNTITIYRADADFVVNPDEGCSVLPVTITNTSIGNDVPAVGGWSWNYGDLSPLNTTKQPGTHIHNYTNTTNPGVDQLFNLSLTVTRNASCFDTKSTTITVNPAVSVSFTTVPAGPVTICDSVLVSFTSSLTIPVAGTTYSWDFGDLTSSNVANPTHIYRNLTNADVTYTARVTATTISGCTSTFSAPIIVHPFVNALFAVDKVAGCTPLTVDAIATTYIGIPAANYVWSFGDGYNPTGLSNPPAHTYPANPAPGPNDSYNLRLTVSDPSGSCTDIMNKTITVYAAALANFTPKGVSGCNPFTVDFANTSLNGSSFLWDFGDGTTFNGADPAPKEFFNNTNATLPYTIQLNATSINGCTHDTSAIINVFRKVEANFGIDVSEACSPLTVNIINNSKGGTYRWYWNSQTAAGVANYTSVNATENFPHTYTNTTGSDITFYLTLVAQNPEGCTDTLTREILVHSSITAGFTYSQPDLCNESDVVFTNTSIGGGSYTMNWNFGDGTYLSTTSSPVNKTFVNNTTNDLPFTVVMTAISENGCTDSESAIVNVYSRVEANFSIPISQGCPNSVTQMFNATIENTSIGNAANIYQWYIDNLFVGGAPTNKDPFVHDYQNGVPSIRKYGVRLRATNSHGCYSEKSDTITVFEYVDALFTILNPAGCTPLSVNFDNLSTAPAATTNYLWEYGDNTSSGGFELPHLFYNADRENDKPFNIKLTVTSENYCSDVYSLPITVYHQPLAKFVADPTSSCPPLVVNMNNLDSKGYDSYQWTFGDGTPNNTTNTVLSHSYPNTLIDFVQNYKLKLWVGTTEDCTHSDSLILNVFPSVVADFTYDASGCSPFISYFTNASTTPAVIFNWNFGDGNTSSQENPFNRFVNIGNADATYLVTLTASSEYNCWDTETKSVVAYAQPLVEFDVTPTLQMFPEARVFIDNKSNLGPWNYAWAFGDGGTSSVAEPSYHDYEHWGEKDIRLQINSATSTCADTLEKTITILPPVVNAAFTVDTDRGCEPLDVQFTASASAYTEIYTYEWEFGDGTTGTGSTPNHTYNSSGLY